MGTEHSYDWKVGEGYSEEYDVKIRVTEEEDVQYFYMDIPILTEKYSEFIDCLRKGGKI